MDMDAEKTGPPLYALELRIRLYGVSYKALSAEVNRLRETAPTCEKILTRQSEAEVCTIPEDHVSEDPVEHYSLKTFLVTLLRNTFSFLAMYPAHSERKSKRTR